MKDTIKSIAEVILKNKAEKLPIIFEDGYLVCPIRGCSCTFVHVHSDSFHAPNTLEGIVVTPMFCENGRHNFFMCMYEHAGHTSFWALEVPIAPVWGWGSWEEAIIQQELPYLKKHVDVPIPDGAPTTFKWKASSNTTRETPPR